MKHTDKPTDSEQNDVIEGQLVDSNDQKADPDSGLAQAPPTLTDTADTEPAAETPATEPTDAAEGPAPDQGDTEQPTAAPESAPVSAVAASSDSGKQKRSKIGILALLLALVALGLCGYGYTLLQQLQNQLSQTTIQLAQGVEQSRQAAGDAERRAAGLEQQLNQARQQASSQQTNINELQDRLTRAMQQISTIGTDSRRDWLLAEVEYLLRLANQRVLMESSSAGALTLLQSADKILQETDDVSIYNVRKALASDIAALEAVPHLDVDGTFLRLAALNDQVDKLRLLPITDRHQLPDMLKEITPDRVSDSWQQGMAGAWAGAMDKLGNLIVIQHRDEPVQPLLSPEQHFFLKQNLHLMLEQAQLALLQGKQAAFDASLAKARNWVDSYFEQRDSTTQALLNGIDGVKETRVAPPLPDISGSLRTLKSYLAAQQNAKGAA